MVQALYWTNSMWFQYHKENRMKTTLRNILAGIAGVIVGSMVNMGLIMMSDSVISPPAGVDVTDMESLQESMHLFAPRHFVFPFLAHALGTLVGAIVAACFAASHKLRFALGIGAVFLVGGIMNVFMLPAPAWFVTLDLTCAYLPMGWLGGKLIQHRLGSHIL